MSLNETEIFMNKHYYMFNKPAGCVTARTDSTHKTVMDYFSHLKNPNLHPCGRLDKDTCGMLLVTDDGHFTNLLMSPENHVSKTYEFVAFGTFSEQSLREIENGIMFTGDTKPTKPCKITITKTGILSDITNLILSLGYDKLLKNKPSSPISYGRITITEGRKHHVKRLVKYAHCSIIGLKRISIGDVLLDESLPCGEFRSLTVHELDCFLKKTKKTID